MDEVELLRAIRPTWIHRATQSLAKGSALREDLRAQLERFFKLLEETVETGDPAWLDTVLTEWASSLTQTDLESGQSSMTQFLSEIMLLTNEICRETLQSEDALTLITALAPAFAYAFSKAATVEVEVRVSYVSNQLKQVQDTFERLDHSKSAFIAVAAHELKTPLTLVEGYTAMLRDTREPEGFSALESEMIEGINGGARRLKTIIDDMIDVSLIDNNLLQLNFQPVWVNRLLALLVAELEPVTRERDQKIQVEEFPGSGDLTFADPERLMQVFRNVLANAIKFTPNHGVITIIGRKLPGFVEVVIQDTGIGINNEDQGIIFEKFSRLGSISLHSSSKTKFKGGGPGLGLHIARGIIEAHGGAIWVESPGYSEEHFPGSTFHILLPLRPEPPDSHMARLLSPLLNNIKTEEQVS